MKLYRIIQALALIPILLFAGCGKDDDIIQIIPEVVSSSPANDAIDVATNASIEIMFNKKMDASTINASSFTLSGDGIAVVGTFSYADSTAVFTPTSDLKELTVFTGTLSKAVKDLSGTPLKAEYLFSFETARAVDITLPMIAETDPLSDAIDVTLDQLITATFSEEMDASSVTATSFMLMEGTNAVTGTVTYSGNTATFTPAVALENGLSYTATVTTEASDLSSNSLATAKVWSFTTVATQDVIPPTVSVIVPLDGAVDVSVNKKITATFSEEMDAAAISATSFMVMEGANAVTGAVTYSGTTATFTPASPLDLGLSYNVTVTTDATDLAGNSLATAKVWSFTTVLIPDVILPTVTITDPISAAIDVSQHKMISATFSEEMDPATINASSFMVMEGTNSVEGTVTYADNTAIFSPTAAFDTGLTYTVTISTEASDLAGNSLATATIWSFTTILVPDVVLPAVSVSDPLEDAAGISLNTLITTTFSEEMDASTINSSSFMVMKGATAVTGTVSYAGNIATFTPDVPLEAGSDYTVTVTTDVTDLAGNAIATAKVWTFTTDSTLDLVLPTVTITTPLGGAIDVPINQVISATFSEEMQASTINSTSFMVMKGATAVTGTVTYAGSTATFTPSVALEAGSDYAVTVTTDVTDLAGNAIATAQAWSFTTVAALDVVLPTVIVTDPLSAAIDVLINQVISATFSEEIQASTINSTSFMVMKGANAVTGTVTYAGSTATFTPSAALEAGSNYTVTVTTDAKDLAGNAIATAKVWSFTTVEALDVVLPTVTVTDPLNAAIDVAFNKVISATFSEGMLASTINATSFKLTKGTTAVTGAVAYSANKATFTPSAPLDASATYTATITTAAKDLAGNSIATAKVWSFETQAAVVAGIPAVNLGSAGNYVILAKTAITNIPTSTITGDMGISPAATSFITGFALTDATGFATSVQVVGNVYAADMASPTSSNLTTAVENMLTAYTDAAGRPDPDFLNLGTGNIGGQTLTPGLYKWGTTVTIPANVTISGSADDVWIFQVSNDLTMSANKNITLVGGAQPKNIFWQVAGEVVIGANSHFEGVILSQTGITFQTGASFEGRALAQTAVILDQNAVTKP